jgi:hypothetical protein
MLVLLAGTTIWPGQAQGPATLPFHPLSLQIRGPLPSKNLLSRRARDLHLVRVPIEQEAARLAVDCCRPCTSNHHCPIN